MRIQFPALLSMAMAMVVAVPAVNAQEPAKPGPEHELLKQTEGTWDAIFKGGPPDAKAVSVSKMGCGGLWLMTDFSGAIEGMPFQGHGVDGFDQDKKKYISIWVDSMTATPMIFEGTYDEKTKTMTQIADGKGPDGKPAKWKSVTKHTDKDHHVFTMAVVGPDGGDNVMLTIEYTRRK
jgi:hypothetical protein